MTGVNHLPGARLVTSGVLPVLSALALPRSAFRTEDFTEEELQNLRGWRGTASSAGASPLAALQVEES